MVDDTSLPATARDARTRWRPDGWACTRSRALWVLAVLAMALDVALTGVGLSMGLVERNLIAREFIQAVGLVPAGVLLKGSTLGLAYAGWRALPVLGRDSVQYRDLVPVAVALPSWAAVASNAALILAVS